MIGLALFLSVIFATEPPDTVKLIVVHTNTIHGALDVQPATWMNPDFPPPVGGAGAALAAIRAERARADSEHAAFLLLDAGEALGGNALCDTPIVKPVAEFMNAAGYDAMTIGVFELICGDSAIREFKKLVKFPILAANLTYPDDTLRNIDYVAPYKIFEFKDLGLKVGVFGLVSDASRIFLTIEDGRKYFFLREVETARRIVKELREQHGVDIVIALTHIGLSRDTLLIDSVPGIDVVIGGFDGYGMRSAYESPFTHGIVVRTYQRLTSLGRLELIYDRRNRTIIDYNWRPISLILEELGEEEGREE